MSAYISEAEKIYLAKRREEKQQLDIQIAQSNAALSSIIREYKGHRYAMNAMGNFVVLEPKHKNLEGIFTTPHCIHSVIDKLK